MAFLSEVVKQNKTYQCDNCKKQLKANEIKLVEPSDNFQILTPLMPFIFIDKDNKITGGSKMAIASLGDKVLACSHCNEVHLFGFDLVKED